MSDGRGTALALDFVGDVAIGIAISNPATATAMLFVGQAASVLGTWNSIAHSDWKGSGVGMASQTVGATTMVTKSLEGSFLKEGTSFAKGLDRLGIAGAAASSVLDVSSAISAYSTCRSTP